MLWWFMEISCTFEPSIKRRMKIEIRQWYLQDKEAFIELNNTVDCTYNDSLLEKPTTDFAVHNWIMCMVDSEFVGTLFRAVVADGKVVGQVQIIRPRGNHSVDGELGFVMLPEYCNKGIATEAVRLIVEEAFDRLPYERISAVVYEPNIASIRVLEKNGFKLEGRKANAVQSNGVVYNTLLYGLLRKK